MLAQAETRVRAHEAILDTRIAVVGTAAGRGSKGGQKMLDDLQRDLKRIAKVK